MQILPKSKTKDRKNDRIILSMTEKEAYSLMTDLLFLRNKYKETRASWSCILNLKEHFDGKMILTTNSKNTSL